MIVDGVQATIRHRTGLSIYLGFFGILFVITMRTLLPDQTKQLEEMYELSQSWFYSFMAVGVSGIMQWKIRSEVVKSLVLMATFLIIATFIYYLITNGNKHLIELIKLGLKACCGI